MATYVLKIDGNVVDPAAAALSLEGLTFSWKTGAEFTFRQAKAHHQADYLEEDDVELTVDGEVVFRGRIVERSLRGEPGEEFVGYRARGLRGRAGDVPVVDPVTGIPEVTFNVEPPDEDNWQAAREDLTCGEIIQWLIDTFENELVAAGVLAQGGTHYLAGELAAMDVVPPEVVLHERNVDEAILTVLRYQADHGYRIDHAEHTFRFPRLSTLDQPTVTIDRLPEVPADRVLATLLRPTTADCYTAYEIRGARELTPAVLSLSQGDLEELWDDQLEATWTLPRAFSEYEQRDSGTDPVVQADTLTDSSKNWVTDEWVDGFLVERLTGGQGPVLLRAYRVLSNTATQVVVDGILFQPPQGYTVTYDLYAGVCPYRYVWSRYRIVDEDKRRLVRELPPVFQVANSFFLSHPLVERKLTVNNREAWVPVTAQVFCDGSGVVLTATPLYALTPGGTPLEPGAATGPEDVRLRCAYASGALVARYPETGYTGTAYSDCGLTRTRVRYLPEFVLDNDREQYRALAQELLQPLKDVNYRGEIPLAGLHWDFADLTRRINVAARDRLDNPITTGFESIASPLAEVRYDFARERTTLLVATNVALALFGTEALEEARSARLQVLQGRYRQLRYAVQVSIGHPTLNDGGARAGGDRGDEPPTTTTSAGPTTTTSAGPTTTTSTGPTTTTSTGPTTTTSTGPTTTTSTGPTTTTSTGPTTTTSSGATTTSSGGTTTTTGGTEIVQECCPSGAPYRFGFSAQGFGSIPVDCINLNVSGELTWDGNSWSWTDGTTSVDLTCSLVSGRSTGGDPRWEVTVWDATCSCSFASWEGNSPDCGVNCVTGGTFDDVCFASGPPSCETGSVTIWPI